jgi:hypothetical protein
MRNPISNFPTEAITVEFWVKSDTSDSNNRALFSYVRAYLLHACRAPAR